MSDEMPPIDSYDESLSMPPAEMSPPPFDEATSMLKIPPNSIQAEQSVLGGLLLDNSAWDKIADKLVSIDFYRKENKLIFEAITGLAIDTQPYDVITLSEKLTERGVIDEVGGFQYLAMLASETPTAANIEAYADIVQERSILRQLIKVGNEISGSAYQTKDANSRELLDKAEQMVFQIAEQRSKGQQGFEAINDVMVKVLETIERLHESDDALTGYSTGFTDFDNMTSGLQPSDLIIVAGRPSMGKTTFAMNIAENVAMSSNKPVAIFSMEMPSEQLVMRIMASLGRIDLTNVRSGDLADDEWPRITSTIGLLSEVKLFIDDTAGLSPVDLRARARRLKRENNGELGLIVIDYLQLMSGSKGNNENRTAEISEISRSLKSLAKELDVPVIALSQLNRNLEQRPNKRPVMSDLRESGSIEQDADLIAFIYRDEVYNAESADKGTAEVIIGKQRNGPIGTTRLTFLGRYTRFENYAGEVYDLDE
jgi:replicative DNA helicase